MTWWLKRAIGSIKRKFHEHKHSFHSVALVIGVNDVVGGSLAETLPLADTPGGPWKVYGVDHHPRPGCDADIPMHYIQCDISNPDDVQAKLCALTDVTHIFYVSWVSRTTEAENCEINSCMLRNVLRAIIPHAPHLRHVCLQTGMRHYLGSFEAFGKTVPHEPPFTEDMARLDGPNFYYAQEDVLFEEIKKKHSLTWSIHRPNLIFGFSHSPFFNWVRALCAYAAVCKHLHLPLIFPGSKALWEGISTAVDADLVADQLIWAAVEPQAKNQAFNCNNGDVFKWKHLWKVLAEEFGIEHYGYKEGTSAELRLSVMMKEKEEVWEEIVREHKLQPTKLEECKESLEVLDLQFRTENILDCTNKAKEHGFVGFRDSEKSFKFWIHKHKAYKVVP